jgi:hypothetical protein
MSSAPKAETTTITYKTYRLEAPPYEYYHIDNQKGGRQQQEE